jgi:hypothetical protein
MSEFLQIDNREVKQFTNRLREMHRSNLPIVVRQTLNDLAFDTKKNTLLLSAGKEFTLRKPSFFRKYSGVQKANGWNINQMHSEIGIIPGDSKAAKQLTKQEYGGTIPNRSYIYMNTARIGGSKSKLVRKQNYIGTKGIVKGTKNRGKKSQLIADAAIGFRENKMILENGTLFQVKSFANGRFKLVPIASYKKDRSVTVQARPFMRIASEMSYTKQEYFFVRNAKKRLEK